MWFEKLTGFKEYSPEYVRANMHIEGDKLISKINGKSYCYGIFSTPSLKELRKQVISLKKNIGKLSLQEIVADIQELHCDEKNTGSLFQVASQFNCLEMVSPEISPEQGVDGYEYDYTQGPTCAIAAGAGTIYRNYFTQVEGKIGQTADNQIDTLAELGDSLGNKSNNLWKMKNGYALATQAGLEKISKSLKNKNEAEIDALRESLRIGFQENTEVTISASKQLVSQVYCSALPVAYSSYSKASWQAFAKLVLEASYEATLCTAIINEVNSGSNKLYLTLLGGGAFGNEQCWIMDAIERAVTKYNNYKLDVYIVSYNTSNPYIKTLVDRFNQSHFNQGQQRK